MSAVRAGPQQADRPALRRGPRFHLPDRSAFVPSAGVIGGVDRDSHAVVVDGKIGMPTSGLIDALAGATAAGKQIDDQFVLVDHVGS